MGDDTLSRAEELFADWLVSRHHGEAVDVEPLCHAHPGQAEQLRALFSHWQRLRAVLERVGSRAASVAERIEGRYGDGVDPHVSLEPEQPSGAPSSALLRR